MPTMRGEKEDEVSQAGYLGQWREIYELVLWQGASRHVDRWVYFSVGGWLVEIPSGRKPTFTTPMRAVIGLCNYVHNNMNEELGDCLQSTGPMRIISPAYAENGLLYGEAFALTHTQRRHPPMSSRSISAVIRVSESHQRHGAALSEVERQRGSSEQCAHALRVERQQGQSNRTR